MGNLPKYKHICTCAIGKSNQQWMLSSVCISWHHCAQIHWFHNFLRLFKWFVRTHIHSNTHKIYTRIIYEKLYIRFDGRNNIPNQNEKRVSEFNVVLISSGDYSLKWTSNWLGNLYLKKNMNLHTKLIAKTDIKWVRKVHNFRTHLF